MKREVTAEESRTAPPKPLEITKIEAEREGNLGRKPIDYVVSADCSSSDKVKPQKIDISAE